jgi:hypothetical protein
MAGAVLPAGSTNTQGLADWAAPYITNYLGKAQGLAEKDYEKYPGAVSAGPSALQNTAFQGIGSLTVPASIGQAAGTAGNIASQAQTMNYAPTAFTAGTFGADQAQQYMNPYLQASLNPQLDEARRQSEITAQQNNAAMTRAGAFGGGRQAILTAENQRNLGSNLANITGQGYNTAFNNAMNQYNADQARNLQAQQMAEQSKQFGAQQGLAGLNTALSAAQAQGNLGATQNRTALDNINTQLAAGATQRGIDSEDIAARQAAFTQERQFPYQQAQFMRDMISGLPTGSVTNAPGNLTGMGAFLSALGGGTAAASALGYKDIRGLLKGLGFDFGVPE